MREHDPEREAEDRAEHEAERRLPRREERRVEQDVDQQRAVAARGLEQLEDHVVDVRHRPVVDRERPREPGPLADAAVRLPERPQDGEEEDARSRPSRAALRHARARGASLPGAAAAVAIANPYHVKLARVPLEPTRTVDELHELRELTGDENGAQRVALDGHVGARRARG